MKQTSSSLLSSKIIYYNQQQLLRNSIFCENNTSYLRVSIANPKSSHRPNTSTPLEIPTEAPTLPESYSLLTGSTFGPSTNAEYLLAISFRSGISPSTTKIR